MSYVHVIKNRLDEIYNSVIELETKTASTDKKATRNEILRQFKDFLRASDHTVRLVRYRVAYDLTSKAIGFDVYFSLEGDPPQHEHHLWFY